MAHPRFSAGTSPAFTLVELLVVIAVIGIMSAMVITSITNAAQDSRWTLARQQQATLQTALNSWIAAQDSVASARSDYASNNAQGKLALLSKYLQPDTFADFNANSTTTTVGSSVLDKINHHLSFSAWTATNQPAVQFSTNQ